MKDERNIVTVTTKNFDNEEITLPVLSLTLGRNDMVSTGDNSPTLDRVLDIVRGYYL